MSTSTRPRDVPLGTETGRECPCASTCCRLGQWEVAHRQLLARKAFLICWESISRNVNRLPALMLTPPWPRVSARPPPGPPLIYSAMEGGKSSVQMVNFREETLPTETRARRERRRHHEGHGTHAQESLL